MHNKSNIFKKSIFFSPFLKIHKQCLTVIYMYCMEYIHYIAKSIGSPPFNESFDYYFCNFHE